MFILVVQPPADTVWASPLNLLAGSEVDYFFKTYLVLDASFAPEDQRQ